MSTPQQRQALLSRLADAKPLDEPTAFTYLWTYFETVGLSEVENNFILKNFDPLAIAPIPRRTDDTSYDAARVRAMLAKKKHNSDFDQTAAAWLKGLDRVLQTQRGTFEGEVFEGFDGRQYRIRPVNNFIARYFAGEERDPDDDAGAPSSQSPGRALAGNRKRSLSLAAYCRSFRVVPTEVKGIRIEASSRWGNPSIHARLEEAARSGLRFISWPVRYALGAHHWTANEEGQASFVRVHAVADENARRAELARAVDAARRERAAFLVLPELCVAAGDIPILRDLLARHQYDEFPILTIAGIEHQSDHDTDVNEAIVLGPDGEILDRHRKMTRYATDDGAKEWITTGTVFRVFESPVGNFATPICLDLFNESIEPVIVASHANVLLVPSLSEKTSAHVTAAYRYLNINLAATVVCNRGLDSAEAARAQTFSVLPGKSRTGATLYERLSGDADYLLTIVE